MATPFCAAAACRISVAAPPGAASMRPRRGVVAVRAEAGGGINPAIRKEEDKVVDTVVTGELAKPLTAYCRCWRSGTFPLCDGGHVKHNKATGDNGVLLVGGIKRNNLHSSAFTQDLILAPFQRFIHRSHYLYEYVRLRNKIQSLQQPRIKKLYEEVKTHP